MAKIADILEIMRQDLTRMPPQTQLIRVWRLSRQYDAGITQVSGVLRHLVEEGHVEMRGNNYYTC